MRESIEASGRDARWEFSRAGLFERTQHMAEACACLAGMVETTAGLYQFMGPQLKAVTGDPQARGHGVRIFVDGSRYDAVSRAPQCVKRCYCTVLQIILPGMLQHVCGPSRRFCPVRDAHRWLPAAACLLHAQTLVAQPHKGAWVHA